MIKVFLPHPAFPLGLIELHRFLSSIRLLSAATRCCFFFFFFEDFWVWDPHWDQSCLQCSDAPKRYLWLQVAGSSVAPGGGRRQRTESTDQRWWLTFVWADAVWCGDKWRGVQLTQHLQHFDRTMNANLRSERDLFCVCVGGKAQAYMRTNCTCGKVWFRQSVGVYRFEILHQSLLSWLVCASCCTGGWCNKTRQEAVSQRASSKLKPLCLSVHECYQTH